MIEAIRLWIADYRRLTLPLDHIHLHPVDLLHLHDEIAATPGELANVKQEGGVPNGQEYQFTYLGVRIYADSHYSPLSSPVTLKAGTSAPNV